MLKQAMMEPGRANRCTPPARGHRIPRRVAVVFASLGFSLGFALPALAQIDYRNLDDDRPTLIEDAYPTERYAFAFLAPYRFEREAGGGQLHLTVPELEYGIVNNGQLGVKFPLASLSARADRVGPGGSVREVRTSRTGPAGLTVFGLYNFNTEGPILPALAIRADVSFGVGPLGGKGTRAAVKAIVTRSWGATRIHLNAAHGFGSDTGLGVADPLNRWTYGGAVDRTFFRRSMLLIGEVYARQSLAGAVTEVNAGVGLRYQWRATTVFDLGVGRRLRSGVGPDVALTVGLSHAFAVAGLMPRIR